MAVRSGVMKLPRAKLLTFDTERQEFILEIFDGTITCKCRRATLKRCFTCHSLQRRSLWRLYAEIYMSPCHPNMLTCNVHKMCHVEAAFPNDAEHLARKSTCILLLHNPSDFLASALKFVTYTLRSGLFDLT